MKNNITIGLIVVTLFVLLTGCGSERTETTTKGKVNIYVDESLYPVIKQEEEKFESLYTDANISLVKTSSREAIVQFLNVETTRVIISFRPMNSEEKNVMQRAQMTPREFRVALDAVVFIVNPSNPVDSLRITQLDSIYRGFTTSWDKLGWKNNSVSIATCIPGQNSGPYELVARKILHGEAFAGVTQILDTSDAMLKYVEEHQNALGIMTISTLRGRDDKVKVVALADPNAPDSLKKGEYFTPHQAHMFRGYYPMCSEIYIYSHSDAYEVGTGFISFITSGPGQKIFLTNGLVPATQPVRLVELTNREIQQ